MKPFNFSSRSHPKFFRYVTENMPDVANVPVIARAMQSNGFMNLKAFRNALSAGQPPLLVLVPGLRNPAGKKRNGFTPESPPVALNGFMPPANSILLEKQLADDFESGKPKLVDTVADDPANNRRVYLAGVTILHELCHWGDWKAHGKFTDGVGGLEHGEQFEFDVYGALLA